MTYPADYTCQDCGEHHYLDCSVPSDIWNQVADPSDMLCAKCIDKRLVSAGLKASCRFYFVGEALLSDLYGNEGVLTLSREEAETALQWLPNMVDYPRVGNAAPFVSALRARIAAWLEATP